MGGEGGYGGWWFPGRSWEGNLGVLGGQYVLVLQLAASVPLAIVPNWPGAQPPKWQLRNQAERGWGGDPGGRGARRGAGGKKFNLVSFCLSHITIPFQVAFLLGAQGGCI